MNELDIWKSDRLGVFTASRISDLLVTAKVNKDDFGDKAYSYIKEKVC